MLKWIKKKTTNPMHLLFAGEPEKKDARPRGRVLVKGFTGGFDACHPEAEADKSYTFAISCQGRVVLRLTGVPGRLVKNGFRCDIIHGKLSLRKHTGGSK